MIIDPHVHLRDGKESHKETLSHAFSLAASLGISALFEMPNTSPPLTKEKRIVDRLAKGDQILKKNHLSLFHGVIGALTADEEQIVSMVRLHKRIFPHMPALKLFAGPSTGELHIADQRIVYRVLSREKYRGVLMVHCEEGESLKPDLFDPQRPESHLEARPDEAELKSIERQIDLASQEGFKGTLHICHISLAASIDLIEKKRGGLPFSITCAVTPHHLLLSCEDMKKKRGILLKVNPPLRKKGEGEKLMKALKEGRIDWIESDHAPHSLEEKLQSHPSGIPNLPIYPHLIHLLKSNGFSDQRIEDLTFNNIVRGFALSADLFSEPFCEKKEGFQFYGFNPFDL